MRPAPMIENGRSFVGPRPPVSPRVWGENALGTRWKNSFTRLYIAVKVLPAACNGPSRRDANWGWTMSTTSFGWFVSGTPAIVRIRNRTTKAVTKCEADPADSTMARFHLGAAPNERGSSSGETSSAGDIPTILTNPPIGKALMPYSVSGRVSRAPVGPTTVSTRPRRVDHTVGPNPMKNLDALI